MKYILIFESGDDFQMCIGIYDNLKEAYGAAYLWLDKLLDGELSVGKDDGVSISPAYALEGETGFGMMLVGDEKIKERVHILFWETKNSES